MREAIFLSYSEMEHQVAFPILVFLKIHLFYFTYINVHVCISHECLCLRREEECYRSLGTGTTDDCESSCGCWEPNLSLLLEQQVPLNAEPSH